MCSVGESTEWQYYIAYRHSGGTIKQPVTLADQQKYTVGTDV